MTPAATAAVAPRPGARIAALRVSPVVVAVVGITAVVALLCTIGADDRWLAALGRATWSRGAIPSGIPFATAPTAGWPNTLVAAELILAALYGALGDRGLELAQLVAVGAAFWVLSRDALAAGARVDACVRTMALVALGCLPSLYVTRAQLFSLILFPVLVLLLRAEAREPSRRIWLAPLLLAAWANLHGAVLLGAAVLAAYLALQRARREPWVALRVALLALSALCLTPAGVGSIGYYGGLLSNLAAQRGVGLWAPIGSSPLDVLLVGVGLLLAFRLRRWRPVAWELAVAVGLLALTVKAARDAIWLLFFLCAPAALATAPARRDRSRVLAPAVIGASALLALGLARGPIPVGAGPALVARAVALARAEPISRRWRPGRAGGARGGPGVGVEPARCVLAARPGDLSRLARGGAAGAGGARARGIRARHARQPGAGADRVGPGVGRGGRGFQSRALRSARRRDRAFGPLAIRARHCRAGHESSGRAAAAARVNDL